MSEEKTDHEKFSEEMGELVKEWYTNCPKPMKFVGEVLKLYKKYFEVKLQ